MAKFKAGDDVACVAGDGDRLICGRTYVVARADDMYVKLAGVHGLWGCDRFEIVKPDDSASRSPVRTVTRKEIVPGAYGPIEITGTYQSNRVTMSFRNDSIQTAVAIVGLDAPELRDAARIFIELADALDEAKS